MARTGRPRKGTPRPDTVAVSFRFSQTLLDAIDAHAERMRRRKDPLAMLITRADAARELIVFGLETVERKEARRGR